MGIENPTSSEVLTEIHLGHFFQPEKHPQTGQITPCLYIYLLDSTSLTKLTKDGKPVHYTAKDILIEGLDNDGRMGIGPSTMSIDRKSSQISDTPVVHKLSGIFSVRLNDANPPFNLNGQKIQGKQIIFMVSNPRNKLVAKGVYISVQKTKWKDKTLIGNSEAKSVICSGSLIKIFGEVNKIIDPWLIRWEPSQKIRNNVQTNFSRWQQLQIDKAKRKAPENYGR